MLPALISDQHLMSKRFWSDLRSFLWMIRYDLKFLDHKIQKEERINSGFYSNKFFCSFWYELYNLYLNLVDSVSQMRHCISNTLKNLIGHARRCGHAITNRRGANGRHAGLWHSGIHRSSGSHLRLLVGLRRRTQGARYIWWTCAWWPRSRRTWRIPLLLSTSLTFFL